MIGLCDRFKVLPSQLDAEDAELIRLLTIIRLGTPEDADYPEGDFSE